MNEPRREYALEQTIFRESAIAAEVME
jgi:hypothetical protein